MADFVLGVDLQVQQVLGLQAVKQQLAGATGQVNITATGGPQLQQLVNQAKQAGTSLKIASDGAVTFGRASKQAQTSVNALNPSLNTASRSAQNFGDQIFLAGRRYAAFVSATAIAFKGLDLLRDGVNAVLDFDQSLVTLQQITQDSEAEVALLGEQILQLGVQTGTSINEIADLAQTLSQAGLRGPELTEALQQLSRVPLTPAFESIDTAVRGVLAALNQFTDQGLTTTDILDRLVNVERDFVVTSEDLATGISRGGAAFAAIGGDLDEFIAAFTTIRQVTQESASTIGVALKTISTRLADPAIIRALESRGIRLLDDEGQFVGPIRALGIIGESLNQITNIQDRVDIAERLGGQRQIARVLALVNNMDLVNKVLDESRNSAGAFASTTEQGLNALNVQVGQLANRFQQLAIDLSGDVFRPFIGGLLDAGNAAASLLETLRPIIPIATQIIALLSGGAIARALSSLAGRAFQATTAGAAFASAGGGFRGAAATITESPFAQAGLIIAASEAASSLLQVATGAETLASEFISAIGTFTAAVALIRGQTITEFLTSGGLFPSLTGGPFDLLGRAAGTALTVGAIGGVALAVTARKSAQETSQRILDTAIAAVDDIQIDPSQISPENTQELQRAIIDFNNVVANSINEQISSVDFAAEGIGITDRVSRFFQAFGGIVGDVLEGNLRDLGNLGGLSTQDIRTQVQSILKANPEFITRFIQSAANAISDEDLARGLNVADLLRNEARGAGLSSNVIQELTSAIIIASGGIQELQKRFEESARTIKAEVQERQRSLSLSQLLIPRDLTSQLVRFSEGIQRTTRIITASFTAFESQIRTIQGITPPGLDFQFDRQRLDQLFRTGFFDETLAQIPGVNNFIQGTSEIRRLFSEFVVDIGRFSSELGESLSGDQFTDIVDTFFEERPNIAPGIQDALRAFFIDINDTLLQASEEGLVTPSDLEKAFRDRFSRFDLEARDAIVESFGNFVEITFRQIQDQVDRLSQIRRLELQAPITPESQLQTISRQLQRAGVGFNVPLLNQPARQRNLEDLLEIQRRRPGFQDFTDLFRAIPEGFFETRQGALGDVVFDQGIRNQLNTSFRDVTVELTRLQTNLRNLEPGTQDFIDLTQRIRQLSIQTVEIQSAFEALNQVSQQTRQAQLEELRRSQEAQRFAAEQRISREVREGIISPEDARRELFDLTRRQEEEQIDLARRFDQVIERDNQRRVELAREIDRITSTQLTAQDIFQQSVSRFASAVDRLVPAVITRTEIAPVAPVTTAISPTELRSGEATIQDALDAIAESFNRTGEINESTQNLIDAVKELSNVNTETSNRNAEVTQRQTDRQTETSVQTEELIGKIDELKRVIEQPGQLRLDANQRVQIDITGLSDENREELRSLMQEAANTVATNILRRALEDLAGRADNETSIAINNILQGLA